MKTKLMLAICAALLFSSAAALAQSYDRDGNSQRQNDYRQGDNRKADPRQNDCRQNDCRNDGRGQSVYRDTLRNRMVTAKASTAQMIIVKAAIVGTV